MIGTWREGSSDNRLLKVRETVKVEMKENCSLEDCQPYLTNPF